MPSPDRTESIYRWLSLGLLLLCIGIGFATIRDYGMGWDEVTRWKSGDAKVDYYRELISAEDKLAVVRNVPNDAYPGFFDMTLSCLHEATGWDRFLLGHWQAFFFGLAGLGALWRIGGIFGGARLGFWSVLLLILTPVFYGHWFHNPKDIPFAATYSLGLLALIEWFKRYPDFKKRWVLIAAITCGLCMATRIAGMVLLPYAIAGVGVIGLTQLWEQRTWRNWKASIRAISSWLLALPFIVLVAYITLLPWWPVAHKNFLSVSGSTLQQLHISASEIPLFFRGDLMWAADAPHYYTLWMFALKATELLLLGLLLALPMGWFLIRERLKSSDPMRSLAALSVLLLGGFFPLIYLTYSGPALHNGARHFLFAFPALCVCAAWAYLQCADWLRMNRPSMLRIAQLVMAVLIFMPLFHLVELHPYQYVYYNSLIGGSAGSFGRYETEYWFTSSKHGVEWLEAYVEAQEGHPALTKVFITGPHQVAKPFLPKTFKITSDLSDAGYTIANTQMLVHLLYESEVVGKIERDGLPILYIYKNKP